jgi:hypothetical protein
MKPIIYKHRKIELRPIRGSGRVNARCTVYIDGKDIGEASSFLALSFAVDRIDAEPIVSEGTLARLRARK